MKRSLKCCAWSFGTWSIGCLLSGSLLLSPLLWMAPAIAQPANTQSPWRSSAGAVSSNTVLEDLSQATVVYLGETHDSPADHQAQLQLLEALHQRRPKLAIALEMFQRPYQEVLNQYLAGEISEADLRQRSQYDQRWGFPWEYYAPILQYAKAHRLPLLALNTPSEVTRKVAQTGLESLSAADRQWIPPLSEIHLNNATYRQRVQEVYEAIHQGHSVSSNFEYFFQAQVLWDETMADRISAFLKAEPEYLVVVLVGQGHVVYGDGIPSRVARRSPDAAQRSILLNPDVEQQEPAIADYFWSQQEK